MANLFNQWFILKDEINLNAWYKGFYTCLSPEEISRVVNNRETVFPKSLLYVYSIRHKISLAEAAASSIIMDIKSNLSLKITICFSNNQQI